MKTKVPQVSTSILSLAALTGVLFPKRPMRDNIQPSDKALGGGKDFEKKQAARLKAELGIK